jgi:hypothetical protein
MQRSSSKSPRITLNQLPLRSQPVSDDPRRELAPFDTDALLELPRDMCLDYCGIQQWQWRRDANLNEDVPAPIVVGLHERTTHAEVLHGAVNSGQRGRRQADWYIYLHPFTPAMFESII